MGQKQSKDELLYQQVNYGNTEGIKALYREGAGLEWIDREGKTPLISACMNPELYTVAKTLIELGADVNAYRPGRHAGTPLHHAAKRGLENTVKLLLSHGANALMMNDDCQTPLEVARAKRYSNVVRAIENNICLFSGWMREFYGPGFLEVLAPQFVSRKVWVVVLPCGFRNATKPFKLELAIYSSLQTKFLLFKHGSMFRSASWIPGCHCMIGDDGLATTSITNQDALPRMVIALWKANMEEPKLNQADPSVIILDNSTIPKGRRRRQRVFTSQARCRPRIVRQTRIKLAPANEGDRQQLQWFYDACKGIPPAMHPVFLHNSQTPVFQATAPPEAEDLELAMAISASLQSAMVETPTFDAHSNSEASASTSLNAVDICSQSGPSTSNGSEWARREAGPSGISVQHTEMQNNNIHTLQTTIHNPAPLAPPVVHEIIDDGPIHYPSIDSSPVDVSSETVENLPASKDERKEDGGASSCVICLDAPSEAVCVPCGHAAGCMSCLNEIKAKKWGCPVCRAKINQVIRLYRV